MKHGVWFAIVAGLVGCGGSLAPNGATGGCVGDLATCSVGCAQETTTTVCRNGVWQCPPGLTLETPSTCPSSSHACDLPLIPLACSCDPTSGSVSCDGGTDGSACPSVPDIRRADGTFFTCVPEDCASDAAVRPICMSGGLACPPGSVALSSSNVCPGPAADAGADSMAGNGCPPFGQDGSIVACVGTCGNDTAEPPSCAGGTWHCPRGTVDVRSCPVQYCVGPPPPPGCTCNPATGALTCAPTDGGGPDLRPPIP